MKLPPFALERFFSAREFAAPVHLCASDCETMRLGDVLALEPDAADAFRELPLGYTETAGAPMLRAAISATYATVPPEGVLVHTGGEEAIFAFMNAVLEPGDHVVVHQPSYQSLAAVPAAIGCSVTPWMATFAGGWTLDLDALRDAITPRTRLLVVNMPHSPTGYLMGHATWADLLGLAAEHGITVFSDEAYRGLEHAPGDRLAAACDLDERAVSLGLVSKGHGLPGLRIGWLASRNVDVLRRVEAFKDYTTICSSAPSEFLAEIAVRHGDRLLARSRGIVAENLRLLAEFLERQRRHFDWVPPRAGPVTFPRLVSSDDVEGFCERALAKAGVLLLPGTVFAADSREIRIGLGRRAVPEGFARLDGWLAGP